MVDRLISEPGLAALYDLFCPWERIDGVDEHTSYPTASQTCNLYAVKPLVAIPRWKAPTWERAEYHLDSLEMAGARCQLMDEKKATQ